MVREEKNLGNFLKASPDKWIESSFEVFVIKLDLISSMKQLYPVFVVRFE